MHLVQSERSLISSRVHGYVAAHVSLLTQERTRHERLRQGHRTEKEVQSKKVGHSQMLTLTRRQSPEMRHERVGKRRLFLEDLVVSRA